MAGGQGAKGLRGCVLFWVVGGGGGAEGAEGSYASGQDSESSSGGLMAGSRPSTVQGTSRFAAWPLLFRICACLRDMVSAASY